AVDGVDLSRVQVDADHPEPRAGELEGERQTDIAEADDAAARFMAADLLDQVLHGSFLSSPATRRSRGPRVASAPRPLPPPCTRCPGPAAAGLRAGRPRGGG